MAAGAWFGAGRLRLAPQRDDLLAELSFLAAAGHTSPALGLQSLDLSKLDLRASPVDSVAESDRR